MITIYLLKNCSFCVSIANYVKEYPSMKICIIYLDNTNDPIINKFPAAFNSTPDKNGYPKKNSKKILGSRKILKLLKENTKKNTTKKTTKQNFGEIDSLTLRSNSCFNNNCNNSRLDRPYGPCDNAYLLQNRQPINAHPHRENIPVYKFGKNLKPKRKKSKIISKLKPKNKNCKVKCKKSKTLSKTLSKLNCKIKCKKQILTTPLGIEIHF